MRILLYLSALICLIFYHKHQHNILDKASFAYLPVLMYARLSHLSVLVSIYESSPQCHILNSLICFTFQHEKRQRNLFDEADLVFHIYRRMRDIQKPDWAVHQFYVDETQDFTQAELSLIIRCCHDPNALFLTGKISL